jgi:hypothetical protein
MSLIPSRRSSTSHITSCVSIRAPQPLYTFSMPVNYKIIITTYHMFHHQLHGIRHIPSQNKCPQLLLGYPAVVPCIILWVILLCFISRCSHHQWLRSPIPSSTSQLPPGWAACHDHRSYGNILPHISLFQPILYQLHLAFNFQL